MTEPTIDGLDVKAIYARLTAAMAEAILRTPTRAPKAVFVGRSEWADLTALCLKWGVEWPGANELYNPESARAKFLKVPIYRVDAETFLQAA